MNNIIEEMLKKYDIITDLDKKNAMKEIIQEIVLCSLSKVGFFKEASFYGGTALRLFYNLDRFSEDLDFSLIKKDINFNLEKYFPLLEKEIKSFGLNIDIKEKIKTKESNIKSTFLKANTKEHLLLFYSDDNIYKNVPSNEVLKIKFEIDINPPKFATFETKYSLLPVPYEIKLYDKESLFAGKIHALLMRNWGNRIKGRDLYDYIFYISKSIKFNHKHLCERLYESGVENARKFELQDIKDLLYKKFSEIDYEKAKKDIEPFIKDISILEIWSSEFFKSITNNLENI
ncbi:nucleotidyl transferase AbiEii/AbiGii toxin family protein [Oceanivirga salmonicida]|uniref:nucleotidyl transferase AbiEii/AbiGii toxin family protein n=1 Tax=Oceanivirga salmonicida TaxID=1769291 RepID=UPI00082CFFF5|nr:nucleotidyl transferase AbiEii/AbiGii toxin family protein [Oceanivirga salmonicida]